MASNLPPGCSLSAPGGPEDPAAARWEAAFDAAADALSASQLTEGELLRAVTIGVAAVLAERELVARHVMDQVNDVLAERALAEAEAKEDAAYRAGELP